MAQEISFNSLVETLKQNISEEIENIVATSTFILWFQKEEEGEKRAIIVSNNEDLQRILVGLYKDGTTKVYSKPFISYDEQLPFPNHEDRQRRTVQKRNKQIYRVINRFTEL